MNTSSNATGTYIIIAASLTGLFTLLSSLFTTFLNNRFQLNREQQQWVRQLEFETEKDTRKQLSDSYSKSIYYLSALASTHQEWNASNYKTWEKNQEWYIEVTAYLTIILLNYPSTVNAGFNTIKQEIIDYLGINGNPTKLAESSRNLKNGLLTLMQSDQRINNISSQ
ncbi:hypothetical protein [Nostoc sp.]